MFDFPNLSIIYHHLELPVPLFPGFSEPGGRSNQKLLHGVPKLNKEPDGTDKVPNRNFRLSILSNMDSIESVR